MSRPLFVLALSLSLSHVLSAQGTRPMVCGANGRSFDMELKCVDACIICDIDGWSGRNDNGGRQREGDLPGVGVNRFCTQTNHNIQWIGFIAGSEDLTLELTVTDCEKGQTRNGGLEAGIFQVRDCDLRGAISVSDCDTDIRQGETTEFAMTNLAPGQYYYLVIDGNNGDICDYSITVTDGTTDVPDIDVSESVRGPARLCAPGGARYELDAIFGATRYEWTVDGAPAGNSLTSRTLDFDFPADGTYEVCVTASNVCDEGRGCRSVRVGANAPTRVSLGRACDDETVTSPSGVTYTETGAYPETLSGEGGCDSVVIYEVEVFPTRASTLRRTICSGTTMRFGDRDLGGAGTYTATYKTHEGCDSVVTLTLAVEECDFQAYSRVTDVSCAGRTDGTIAAGLIGPPAAYTLGYRAVGAPAFAELALARDGTPARITDLPAGEYELRWRSSLGGERITADTVAAPPPLSLALDAVPRGSYEVSCAGERDGALSASGGGGTGVLAYAWSDGGEGAVRDGLGAGAFEVTVTDENGCQRTANYTLREPPPIALAARGRPEGCDLATEPGGIEVTELSGGQPPLQLSLRPNGRVYTRTGTFDADAGEYMLLAVDGVGCRRERTVTVGTRSRVSVSMPTDTLSLRPRRTLVLEPSYSGEVDVYRWRGDGTLDCEDCAYPMAAPTVDTVYEVAVASVDGCRDTARLAIVIETDPGAFAPTAISPDGDGRNDAFTIFTVEPDAVIESLDIFNRWGEHVFTIEGIPANQEAYGWTGELRDREVNSAVYVYVARIRLSKGGVRELRGDFTVMR